MKEMKEYLDEEIIKYHTNDLVDNTKSTEKSVDKDDIQYLSGSIDKAKNDFDKDMKKIIPEMKITMKGEEDPTNVVIRLFESFVIRKLEENDNTLTLDIDKLKEEFISQELKEYEFKNLFEIISIYQKLKKNKFFELTYTEKLKVLKDNEVDLLNDQISILDEDYVKEFLKSIFSLSSRVSVIPYKFLSTEEDVFWLKTLNFKNSKEAIDKMKELSVENEIFLHAVYKLEEDFDGKLDIIRVKYSIRKKN